MSETVAIRRGPEVVTRDPIGPLTELAGIGPARAARLAELGIHSIRALLCLIPTRIELWPEFTELAAAREKLGATVAVRAQVAKVRFSRFGRRSLVRVTLESDETRLDALFFNQSWLCERFVAGGSVAIFGRVVSLKHGVALAAQRLATEDKPFPAPGDLVATYPSCAGLAPTFVRELCQRAATGFAERLHEPLSSTELAALDLPPLGEAVMALHRPPSLAAFERARARIALEPLLAIEARLLRRAWERERGHAPRIVLEPREFDLLLAHFRVRLTHGQRAAVLDLRADLARAVPMRRLLQADVGSGKTLVACAACLAAASRGFQAAFMAPTEILAQQHREGTREWFERAGVTTAIVLGSQPARERARELARVASGAAQVVFGTQALFSESTRFAKLALAVIDEQHRFGVLERGRLLEKGREVHALLLTATPIPRTLALTLYGDLEVTSMRDRPPGRGALTTHWIANHERAPLRKRLIERLAAGERMFWIVPRIGDRDDDEESGAEARFAKFARSEFARFGLELVHGRIEPRERALRLARFRSGAARILVSTTIVEVGVDVPEATIMVIEGAERLGLAQLHQLRGRVGRGPKPSVCYLLGKPSAEARFRLLEREHDGFAIAEADLAARGMGDLAGVRQAGANAEGLGDVAGDLRLLIQARDVLQANERLVSVYAPPAEETPTI